MSGEQDRDALSAAFRRVAWLEPEGEWAAYENDTIDAVLASDWLADLIAQAEQRGREDNERHDMCLVHGSKALADHDRRVRASALREAAADWRAIGVPFALAGRWAGWLRGRADRIEGGR